MDAWETLTPLFREATHKHMLRSFWDPESWDAASHGAKLELMREHLEMCFCVQCTSAKGVWGKCILALHISTGSDNMVWGSGLMGLHKSHRRIPSLKRDRKCNPLKRDRAMQSKSGTVEMPGDQHNRRQSLS